MALRVYRKLAKDGGLPRSWEGVQMVGASRRKRTAFNVLAAVFAAASWLLLFGLLLLLAWIDTEHGGSHRVHDMGIGGLYGVILAGGFVAQLRNPERKISAFYQILAVALAVTIAGAWAARGYALVGGFIAIAWAILLGLHPNRLSVLGPERGQISVVLAGLAVLGAIPLLWFASSMARLERNGLPTDPHVKDDHWTIMAAMAVGILLVALLSSLKLRGWRISAWSAGAAAFLYGLITAVYPHRPGAEGTGWALAAMGGGLVFIAAAEWKARTKTRGE